MLATDPHGHTQTKKKLDLCDFKEKPELMEKFIPLDELNFLNLLI